MFEKRGDRRGQVTIFIIIAIAIVVAVVGFFVLRSTIFQPSGVPAEFEPLYQSFLTCVSDDALVGVNVLESQGGYIELPEFEAGSGYMPFSSQLNFLGNPIPYWYYVSGSNIQKSQVPSKGDMEDALGNYIDSQVRDCLLSSYSEQGFDIVLGEPSSSVTINDNTIGVNLDMDLRIEKANQTALVSSHAVSIDSALGSLYSSARELYDYEQQTLFLENYGVDTLRLYAPVDGVEISCSPLVWNAEDVFDDLEQALEDNVASLKVKGGDFTLTKEENKYFVIDAPVTQNVRFLTSRNWPHAFEVNPADNAVLIASTVGTQPGLGTLGFCYVPYHFVYDVKYPVLSQVSSGDEIFQFPMAVVIAGNRPRVPYETSAVDVPISGMCDYKNTPIRVNTFDKSINPVSANISFKCFNEVCPIGETSDIDGSLNEDFPQCVNGFVIADSPGFERAKYYVPTTTQQTSIDMVLNKKYSKNVQIKIDNKDYNGDAILTFVSEGVSRTVLYPSQKTVELSEGQWEVQMFVYRNTSITIPETNQEQCTTVPQSGLGGFFGATEERCFDVNIPEQKVTQALLGGGKQNYFILESELQGSSTIDINSESLPAPKEIEDLQKNYIAFEDQGLNILFK